MRDNVVDNNFKPSVRYTNGLTLWFKNKREVEVRDGRSRVIISRYFIRQNSYEKKWKPFCEKLYRLNSLHTIWDVMDLATKYELDMHSSYDRIPQPIPDDIWVRPAIYRYQRRNNGDI